MTRENKDDLYENKIFSNWEARWSEQNGDEFTKGLVLEIYNKVKSKKDDNRKKNIRFKRGFVGIHVLAILVLGGCVFSLVKNKAHWSEFLSVCSFCIIIAIWASAVVSKWIDIKKYQETWARHSKNLFAMNREMLLFYYGLPPYENLTTKKDQFINNMLDIWLNNQMEFNDNLVMKEKKLTEDFMEHLTLSPKIKDRNAR